MKTAIHGPVAVKYFRNQLYDAVRYPVSDRNCVIILWLIYGEADNLDRQVISRSLYDFLNSV